MAADAAERRPVIREGRRNVPVVRRRPCRGPVARLARQGRDKMSRRFASRHRAIMAAGAWRGDAGVIEPGARKGRGALVTGLARIIRWDMRGRLPKCGPAIVAAGAIRHDSRVIHPGPSERHGALVTVLAGRVCDDVTWGLAGRGDAIVAGGAATGNARVAESCTGHG